MGLDMYLSKKTYVKQWSHNKPEDQFEVTVKKGGKPYKGIQSNRISYVTESLMYWRKANQIHGWFCNNTSEITPEVLYSVTTEDLRNLLETCRKIVDIISLSKKKTVQVVGGWKSGEEYMVDVEVYECQDEVMEVLPPTQGFFYGNYEIDDYYKDSVVETIKFLVKELATAEDGDEFEYYASW